MGKLYGLRRYGLVGALLVGLGGYLAMYMALTTGYDSHPDEFSHVDAFCYFASHAWMPSPGLNGLNYRPEGASRVYNPEVVYWVYGRADAGLEWIQTRLLAARAPSPEPATALTSRQFLPIVIQAGQFVGPRQQPCIAVRYMNFRLFNTMLFVITLGILFAVGAQFVWAAAIGLVMLCLPQVIYTYAYANSDAWALSFALFLLIFAMAEHRPLASPSKALLLGLLTGMVLLGKESVWPAIPFAYTLVGYRVIQDWRAAKDTRPQMLFRQGPLAIVAALLIITPMRIWYPLTQGADLEAQLAQIREERSDPGFKPSNPFAAGRQLRTKGVGLDQVVFNLNWVRTSAQSFYGYFGYLAYPAPVAAYWTALSLAIMNALLSLAVMRQRWQALPDTLRLAVVSAPVVVSVCVAASIYNSWTHDFQPQGRYLFVAVVPLALWMWGTWEWEGARLRAARLGSAIVLLALSAYVLWTIVVQNPAFYR